MSGSRSRRPRSDVIRLATADDLPALAGIERSAASLFGALLPPALLKATVAPSLLSQAQAAGRLWVACDPPGPIVGFAVVDLLGKRAHIAELDVSRAHQRRGIGTALLQEVEGWASEAGLEELTLTTFRDIPWNAPFYRRQGFEPVPDAELDAHLRGCLEREAAAGLERSARIAMRKRLGPAGRFERRAYAAGKK